MSSWRCYEGTIEHFKQRVLTDLCWCSVLDDDLFRQDLMELKPEVRANFQGMIEAGSVYQPGTKLSSPDRNSSVAVPLTSDSRVGRIFWPARDNMSGVPFYRRHLNPEGSSCEFGGALSCRSHNR